jgi:hypothetical protein
MSFEQIIAGVLFYGAFCAFALMASVDLATRYRD